MIFNWNTFNSIAINGWSNSIIVINNAGWNNNGGAGYEEDKEIKIILDNYNCKTDITWLTSDFYIGDYDIGELELVDNAQVFVQDIEENENYDVKVYGLLWHNGSGFNSNYITSKNIKLKLYIQWTNTAEFNNKLDRVKAELSKRQNCFIKKINGEYRQIRVTPLTEPRVLKHYNRTFCIIEHTFLTLDPYFYKIEPEEKEFTFNSNNINEIINNEWYKETYITIEMDVISGTSDNLKISLNDNIIRYNKVITSWDKLILNYKLGTLEKNETLRWYEGVMTQLNVWNNTLNFEKNGDTEINVKVSYNKTYI